MRGERVVSVLVAAIVAAACDSTGVGVTPANSYAGKIIKLGAILSITGTGSAYGPSSREGMELAVGQINKSGGVNGATINLTVRDDASTQSQSVQVAETMIQSDQDLALLGPTLSNSAVAVHPLAENQHIPILAVSTTGINIVPNCNFPSTVACRYVFRDSLGEETAIPANIKSYTADAHPTTGVLLVSRDDKFSSDGGKIVEATVGQYGITLKQTIGFNKTELDLSRYVTQAVQPNPDLIFITSLCDIPAKIMIEARKQGRHGCAQRQRLVPRQHLPVQPRLRDCIQGEVSESGRHAKEPRPVRRAGLHSHQNPRGRRQARQPHLLGPDWRPRQAAHRDGNREHPVTAGSVPVHLHARRQADRLDHQNGRGGRVHPGPRDQGKLEIRRGAQKKPRVLRPRAL